MDQDDINYHRIAASIEYINQHYKEHPSLDDIAEHVHLSPFHFQRLFKKWAGVSPKKFIQFLTLAYAKQSLKKPEATLFDVSNNSGLSSTSRLHDLFVRIEGMTPAEFKNQAKDLYIKYKTSDTIFGKALIASTTRGICYMAFFESEKEALNDLFARFKNAHFSQETTSFHQQALACLEPTKPNESLNLHLWGSPFQLKVWEALLKIPLGQCSTYGQLANDIGNPKASRAVGTAIGSNPIAFIIPCHRVIQTTGKLGGYRWHPTRKAAILGWEAAKLHGQES